MGKVISDFGKRKLNGVYALQVFRKKDIVVIEGLVKYKYEDINDSTEEEEYGTRTLYGFWNLRNQTFVFPKYEYIKQTIGDNELLPAFNEKKMYYLNQNGKEIWRESDEVIYSPYKCNINYIQRANYRAHPAESLDKYDDGTSNWSDNYPRNVTPISEISQQQLKIILNANERMNWEGFDAMKLTIVNYQADTVLFPAQEGRLNLKMQALDTLGEWQDIEYLSESWCGNSYHTLYLAANQAWDFATPIYEGETKTKLRAALEYYKKGEVKQIIYSNEVEGEINLGQFKEAEKYVPTSFMEPYHN